MIYRKKLIEVALPLDAINKEAAREKSIRHGHPSTLHLWWARRPLAACRAVLFASLVDDPGNDLPEKEAEIERKRLFDIIEELVLWENSNDERVLHAARTEIARSVARTAGVTLPAGELTPAQVREALEKYAPPVLDPFCGGGSIPLEAQRLGLKAYASDLNPVAVLITKALIEIPPKFAGLPPVHPRKDKELFASEWKGAAGLAEDVRYYGQWMRDEAEKRIGHLYPKGPNGETVIAWLWARTVKCPNPACGATMPLARSFALSTKRGKETWVEPVIEEADSLAQGNAPHPPTPSPTQGEGEKGSRGRGDFSANGEEDKEFQRWDIPEALRRKMVEVARQLRREPTPSQDLLWQALRGKQLDGIRFRREQNVGPFILDFYCSPKRLVVEIDGPIHDRQVEADRARQQLLESLGLRFVRVKAQQVEEDLPSVLLTIRQAFTNPLPLPSPALGEGLGVGGVKTVRFTVQSGKGHPPEGTVNRRGARCIVCGQPVPFDHVRAEGQAGRMGAQLMAMVTEGHRGRNYNPPSSEHEAIAHSARPKWTPDTELPAHALGFRVQLYGMTKHRDLFTMRQLTALSTLGELVGEAQHAIEADAAATGLIDDQARTYAEAIGTYLGLGVSRSANTICSLAVWSSSRDQSVNVFSRQALPMNWDFPEVNPFAGAAGDFAETTASMARSVVGTPTTIQAVVTQRDATAINTTAQFVLATDPPYYDNIGYADLSDFFYVWLRHSLGKTYPDLFSTLLVPKTQELIAAPSRHNGNSNKAEQFFEEGLGKAFAKMRASQDPSYPLTIFYAFKQSESDDEDDTSQHVVTASTGWETMLEGLIRAGFALDGTWPMRTERPTGVKVAVNALASSIILVCRPRSDSASLATRREFVATLKKELPAALTTLTHEGIAPVDLAQASIGPGMAVFSRYAKVLEADGTPMGVRTALQIINQELDEYLTAEEGDLDRETRFALAWYQQFGHGEGAFGEADVLARAKDTAVETMVRAGILYSRAGKVRLLRRGELEEDWDPRIDARLTVWECTQQLIRRLNETGEAGAARLLKQLGGGRGEDARALAYRLYAICERKKWADEALSYNALVVSWPEIEKKAAGMEGEVEQGRLL
jgi:adenine-specific DNA methylase/very-short-patch-repair endonuclease